MPVAGSSTKQVGQTGRRRSSIGVGRDAFGARVVERVPPAAAEAFARGVRRRAGASGFGIFAPYAWWASSRAAETTSDGA